MIKKYLLILLLLFSFSHDIYAQENGAVTFDLSVRNSLKFNRHIVNPTFSFVREQNKYISFSNKKQWAQFENAPQAFLFGYSGRFSENIGAGITLFQRDYGIYTTFGGLANFSYNVTLDRESNLTFGLNLGAYQSSINTDRVIANLSDPSLNNTSSNFMLTINPGINYGTTFFDFGISVNNLVAYNISDSNLIEEDPEQAFQAHAMYTGYIESRGFFSESKFSALVRSEFKKEKTVLSGVMMLSIPKGIWGQIGYNNLYGASAGLGINISSQIAIEYNYEQAIGELSGFGNSHEILLAYRFNKRNRYNYNDFDEEVSLFKSTRSKRVLAINSKTKKGLTRKSQEANIANEEKAEEIAEPIVEIEEEKIDPIAEVKLKAEQEAKQKAEEEARIAEEEARIKAEQEAKQKAEEEARIAEEEARIKAEQEAKKKAEEEARIAEEERIRQEQLEEVRIKAEQEAKLKAEEEARIAEEERIRQEQLEEVRIKAEQEAKLKAEEEARIAEEERIRQEQLDAVIVSTPKSENEEMINSLTELTNTSKIEQQELLLKLQERVDIKQQDLDDLKEENDLSERGIFVEPKPFKSISAENAAINQIKTDLDNLIKEQSVKIQELETVYISRLKKAGDKLDPLTIEYSKAIQELKTERLKTIRAKENLIANLDKIEVATEIERKRRIKRALYDNDQDRYQKDRATLQNIINSTPISNEPLTEEDFDFGEEQSAGIQILKGVNNVENGYYLVVAVHSDKAKRDEFLRNMVSNGQENVNFFYDVNTSKYYIYYEKHNYLNNAQQALKNKGTKPYNSKMSLIKIED